MQSRLEEEEEAKVALMSRIQRLTKLILVSSKNSIPGCLSDVPSHQRNKSSFDDVSFLYKLSSTCICTFILHCLILLMKHFTVSEGNLWFFLHTFLQRQLSS